MIEMPRRTLRQRRTSRGGAPAKAEKNNNNNTNYPIAPVVNNSSDPCGSLFAQRNEAMEVIGQKNLEIRELKREIANLQNENNLLTDQLKNARNPRANAGLAAARMNSTVRNVGRRIPFRHM